MTPQHGSLLGELIERATTHGRVDLVDLGEDAEAVLGRGSWILTHGPTYAQWEALEEDERHGRSVAALNGMIADGAVRSWRVEGGHFAVDLSPELYLVDAARRNPSFIAYGLDDAGRIDGAVTTPRVYGLMDADGLRGVVVELVGPVGHSYRLLSVAAVVTALTTWLWRAVTTDDLGIRLPEATVVVVHPPHADGVTATPATAQSLTLTTTSDGAVRLETTLGSSPATSFRDVETHLAAALGGEQ